MLAALLVASLAGGVAAAADPDQSDLRVVTTGLRNQEGEVLVMLFDGPGAWLTADRAVRIARAAPAGGVAAVTFENLPRGEYAVSVIHDENRNGEMDMRWLPYPRPAEGAGTSNDAPASFGPPTYDGARFQLTAPTLELSVTVRYTR